MLAGMRPRSLTGVLWPFARRRVGTLSWHRSAGDTIGASQGSRQRARPNAVHNHNGQTGGAQTAATATGSRSISRPEHRSAGRHGRGSQVPAAPSRCVHEATAELLPVTGQFIGRQQPGDTPGQGLLIGWPEW